MRENNNLESKYQPGTDQLAIYEVTSRGWTRDNQRKIHGVAWKGHDPRKNTLSCPTSSSISSYLPLMQYTFFLED